MTTNPLVSVIIPAYNYARYIEECVRSVLAQNWTDWEVIIVDDGSTDDTPKIAPQIIALDPSRISYHRLDNGGVARARNHALKLARGEFILPLDADDILVPSAIEDFITALRNEPEAGFAYSCLENFGNLPGEPRYWHQGPFFRGRITQENIAASASMWRRSLFEQGVKYREVIFEDWDLWLQIVAKGHSAAYVPKVLFKYRMHISGRTGRNKYLYLPAVLQVMANNPSLYEPTLVSWAENSLCFSPECWNKETIVFLPSPDSKEYTDFSGPMHKLAQEFLKREHFVVVIGAHGIDHKVERGLNFYGMRTGVDLAPLARTLGMIGANLLIFSEFPDSIHAHLKAFKNVYGIFKFGNRQSTDFDWQVSQLHGQVRTLGNDVYLDSGALDILTSQPSVGLKNIADRALLISRSELQIKKPKEEKYWRTLKDLNEYDFSQPRRFNSAHLETTSAIVTVEPGQERLIIATLNSLHAWTHKPQILVSLVTGTDAQKLQEICTQHNAQLVEGFYASRGAALNAALKFTNEKWVLAIRASTLVSPNFKEVWESSRAQLGERVLYLLDSTRLPIMSQAELPQSNPYFPALRDKGRIIEHSKISGLMVLKDWVVQQKGFNETYLLDGAEEEDLSIRAESDGVRSVWLQSGNALEQWSLRSQPSRIDQGNQTSLEQMRNAPNLIQNSEYWGTLRHIPQNSILQQEEIQQFELARNVENEILSSNAGKEHYIKGLILWGQHNLVMKNIDNARLAFEDILTLDPDVADAHALLAQVYMLKGHIASAGHHIEKTLMLIPKHDLALQAKKYLRDLEK